MMGVFTTRPSLPRYKFIWDANVVLEYIADMDTITLLQLSMKLCTLFLFLSAQRCQTLHLIELSDISFQSNSVTIRPTHLLKQTKPGHHLDNIVLEKYANNSKQCIVSAFQQYISRTNPLRDSENKLLISTQRPHKAVSTQTVSRWVKTLMVNAGYR